MKEGIQNLLTNTAFALAIGGTLALFAWANGSDAYGIKYVFWGGFLTVPFWKMVEGMTNS